MAAELRLASLRVKALIDDVQTALQQCRAGALGADLSEALLVPLARVKSEHVLRLLLTQLHRRLKDAAVLSCEGLCHDWLQRCTEPGKDTLIELCEELDEAIDWNKEAAWRKPEVIVLGDSSSDDDDAGTNGALADAKMQSLQERNQQLELENKKLKADNKLLLRELKRGGEPTQRAAPQQAAAGDDEPIDLCSTDSDDEVVVAVTPPRRGVKPVKTEAEAGAMRAEQVVSEEGAAPVSPLASDAVVSALASDAGASELAARGSLKRAAEPCEAPPPKQPRQRAAVTFAPAHAAKGHGTYVDLMGALLRCSGQLRKAKACKSKLHLLGEKSGVFCLHAAAYNDANAGVLALILAHAAADGPDTLRYALKCKSVKGTAKSGFARRSAHLILDVGASALDFACIHGAVECAELLLQAGANPNARTARLCGLPDGSYVCALDLAACAGHLGVIRVLLRAKAKVNTRNDFGWTPLHWAAEYAHYDAVRLLLLAGADPDAADRDGRTALVWAMASDNGKPVDACESIKDDCHDDRVAVMVELAYAGARVGFPARADEVIEAGDYGRTLLHACAGGLTTSSLDLLRRLLTEPVSPPLNLDVGAGELGTPLDLAIHAGWAEGALLLLNHGATIDAPEETKFTPLMRAACLPAGMGGSDLIRLCCLKKANIEASDEDGRTAAHWAATFGRVDALRTLRAMGADLNARDLAGNTPLMIAQRHPVKLQADIAAVVNAPACPPRFYQPGEDAACDQEEVAIEVHAAALPDDTCFIAHNVEASGVRLNKPQVQVDKAGACCTCILCIPGVCPCLSTSGVVDVAAELKRVDAGLADEMSHELSKGDDSANGGRHFWLAVGTGLRSISAQPVETFATGVHLATHVRATAPPGLPAVGLAVALLALRRLLPLLDDGTSSALDLGWEKRVRGVAKSPAFVEELSTLLLELDDAAAEVVRADVESRSVPVWRAKQAAAWLAEARPAWRATARQGRNGAPITSASLASAMNVLLVSLSSVHTPLRVKPGAVTSSGFASLNLCSPHCPCAAGGCRASGVQYPLQLRSVGEGVGVGVFAKTKIPRGVLVAPYVGEVTNNVKADAQFQDNTNSHFYYLDLEAEFWSRLRTRDGVAVIDGANFSNTTRYFNHSCSPNLGRAAVDWPGLEAGPLVFLYALVDIDPGTEMCWVCAVAVHLFALPAGRALTLSCARRTTSAAADATWALYAPAPSATTRARWLRALAASSPCLAECWAESKDARERHAACTVMTSNNERTQAVSSVGAASSCFLKEVPAAAAAASVAAAAGTDSRSRG